eukprot:364743-Chlamydomonas_euryale.AAC.95
MPALKLVPQIKYRLSHTPFCLQCASPPTCLGTARKGDKVIRIPDIVAVRKKKYFRLPNSIELENVNGRRDFFTSFLARDSAYRRIGSTAVIPWSDIRALVAERAIVRGPQQDSIKFIAPLIS